MIREWIREKRGLAEKATKGPWSSFGLSKDFDAQVTTTVATPSGHMSLACDGLPDRGEMQANNRFITDARTSLPAALDALEVAVEALKRVETEHQDYDENGGGQYGIGVTDGHRYAAAIAASALAAIEKRLEGGHD